MSHHLDFLLLYGQELWLLSVDKETFPSGYLFPNRVREALLQAFQRTTIMPMGDRMGVAQGEPLTLQSSPSFGLRLDGLVHTCGRSFPGHRNKVLSDRCTCVLSAPKKYRINSRTASSGKIFGN